MLMQRLKDSGGEEIDLNSARVWVAVEHEQIIGMLPLRMCWQAEPLLVFPEVTGTHKRRRAGFGMYRAMMAWIAGPENRTGIRWLFGITRSDAVARWLGKLGWFHQYAGAKTFLKYM